jgi:Tol biopolymer transport system component
MTAAIRSGRVRMLVSTLAAASGMLAFSSTPAAATGTFSNPQSVMIEGYSGTAMEPFISPDGQYLLFNTSNVPPNIPTLQMATRVNAQTFEYQGEIQGEGVNEPGVLSGTPTIDQSGNLYFISPRSYGETLSTVFTGQFTSGTVTGVDLVSGISSAPFFVDFDTSVSRDGSRMYVSIGDFHGGVGPKTATLALFDKSGSGFMPDPNSATILKAVNKAATLNYAASISPDGLELFFTAASPAVGQAPAIYRATRTSSTKAFGHVEKISAITGFAEAPAISSDGSTLYFHKLIGSEYKIEDVTRERLTPTVTKISPVKGPVTGGTTVKIKGANLGDVTAVSFGGAETAGLQITSGTLLTAVSPPGSRGPVHVTVTTPAGTSAETSAARFTYK